MSVIRCFASVTSLQVHAFLYDADALLHSAAALQLEEEQPAWQLEFYPPCMADSAMSLLQVSGEYLVSYRNSPLCPTGRVRVKERRVCLAAPSGEREVAGVCCSVLLHLIQTTTLTRPIHHNGPCKGLPMFWSEADRGLACFNVSATCAHKAHGTLIPQRITALQLFCQNMQYIYLILDL